MPGNDQLKTTLDILEAIEDGEGVTQRRLARKIGIALGLTNALIKRCVNMGLVKVREIPVRRYSYFLTPEGFSEKSRLLSSYISGSLDFFRIARTEYGEIFRVCASTGQRKILLCGACELAEIAVLAAHDHDVSLVGVWDRDWDGRSFLGLPIHTEIPPGDDAQSYVVTHYLRPQQVFEELAATFDPRRIHVAPLLRVNVPEPGTEERGRVP